MSRFVYYTTLYQQRYN